MPTTSRNAKRIVPFVQNATRLFARARFQVIVIYLFTGILLFAAYDAMPTWGRVSYVWFFPLHAIIGGWIRAIIATPDKLLNNRPLWTGVVVIFAVVLLAMGGC